MESQRLLLSIIYLLSIYLYYLLSICLLYITTIIISVPNHLDLTYMREETSIM